VRDSKFARKGTTGAAELDLRVLPFLEEARLARARAHDDRSPNQVRAGERDLLRDE
jgi:hypothetical protein